jgi:hypothetical protein
VSRDNEVTAQSLERVEAFVLRARRIEAHSLAANRAELVAWTTPRITVLPGEAPGQEVLVQRTPPEEQVESLAARVRPLILASDPVYYANVLKALGWLLRRVDLPDVSLPALRSEWRAVDPKSGKGSAYHVETAPVDGSAPVFVATDNTLAYAWFYGDVVHADPLAQASAADFDITERYRAAVHLVARIAALALVTYDLLLYVHSEGHIALPEAVLTSAVTVTETETRRIGRTFCAPLGTDVPGPMQSFGEGWTPVVQGAVPSEASPAGQQQ